jgi:hypothetical protein
MKNLKYNFLFILIILFIIYIIYSYSYSIYTVEEFTPYLREIYRPYFRNIRIVGEGFYVNQKNNIINLFRKFGIL